MSYRPLKSQGSALKELTLSEEDYLAYRTGRHLSDIGSNVPYALCTSSTPGYTELIGTYTDTLYNQGVGATPDPDNPPPIISYETDLFQYFGPVGWCSPAVPLPSQNDKNDIAPLGYGLHAINSTTTEISQCITLRLRNIKTGHGESSLNQVSCIGCSHYSKPDNSNSQLAHK